MVPNPERSPRKRPAFNRYNSYLRYSGLAVQLLVTLALAGWIGYEIDQWMANKYPVFMLLLGFVAFVGSIYQVYRSLNR
jgi:F0F1-type ATP synthase assembly protein I